MGRSKVVAWQSQQRAFGYLYRPCSALGRNERNSRRLVESGHQLFLGAPVSRAWRHSCINDRRMSLDSGDVVPLWLIRRWLYLAPVLCCFVVSLLRRFLFPTRFFSYNHMDVADFTFFVLFVNSYLRHFIFGFLGKLLFSNFRRPNNSFKNRVFMNPFITTHTHNPQWNNSSAFVATKDARNHGTLC